MITYVIFLRGKTHGRSCLFILSIYELNIIPIMMILLQSVDKPIIGLFLRYASKQFCICDAMCYAKSVL